MYVRVCVCLSLSLLFYANTFSMGFVKRGSILQHNSIIRSVVTLGHLKGIRSCKWKKLRNRKTEEHMEVSEARGWGWINKATYDHFHSSYKGCTIRRKLQRIACISTILLNKVHLVCACKE